MKIIIRVRDELFFKADEDLSEEFWMSYIWDTYTDQIKWIMKKYFIFKLEVEKKEDIDTLHLHLSKFHGCQVFFDKLARIVIESQILEDEIHEYINACFISSNGEEVDVTDTIKTCVNLIIPIQRLELEKEALKEKMLRDEVLLSVNPIIASNAGIIRNTRRVSYYSPLPEIDSRIDTEVGRSLKICTCRGTLEIPEIQTDVKWAIPTVSSNNKKTPTISCFDDILFSLKKRLCVKKEKDKTLPDIHNS